MLSAWPALTPSAATEHDNEPLLQSTAASSTAGIPEAATEHSEIQQLLAFANASTSTVAGLLLTPVQEKEPNQKAQRNQEKEPASTPEKQAQTLL